MNTKTNPNAPLTLANIAVADGRAGATKSRIEAIVARVRANAPGATTPPPAQ